ncbi:MAG TPA: hypothetical protein VML50_13945 [Anaeromyxobacter sp.]|nr:hypothetical protein [Anaeromyxobacter sp.]
MRPLAFRLALALPLAAACAHRSPAPPAPPPPPAALPVPAAPPHPDLGPVRAGAEAVLRTQADAAWRALALGEAADPAAAWAGHEGLLSDATLADLAAVAEPAGDEARSAHLLRAWLLGERLGRASAAAGRQAAQGRAAAAFAWGGRQVALREVPALLADEHDADRRRSLAEAATAAAQPVLPLSAAREGAVRAEAHALGFRSTLALAAELRGERPEALAALAQEVLAGTEELWRGLRDELARAEGLAPEEVRTHDLPRLLRDAVPARAFPADKGIETAVAVLSGMGLAPGHAGLRIEAAARPGTLSAPIALPLDPPADVRVSAAPVAGLEALRALLHELGVAESYAHAAPELPVELRWLGSPALPEAAGRLLEEVAGSADWLVEHGVEPERARTEARAAAARRLLRAREAAARLLAAVGRARAPGPAVPGEEAALAARACGCAAEPYGPVAWQLDPDPLLRSAEALRAELLAAELERALAARAGGAPWWRAQGSGAFLAAAWAKGGRRTPEEVARALGASGLGPAALVAVVRARGAVEAARGP